MKVIQPIVPFSTYRAHIAYNTNRRKMKFNWRANWEILLVLVIIVVGIVITTIAAIKNKGKLCFLNLSCACSLFMTLLVTWNGSHSLNCDYATACSLSVGVLNVSFNCYNLILQSGSREPGWFLFV